MHAVITIQESSIGECWLSILRRVVTQGRPAAYDGAAIRELANVTIVAERADPADALIGRLADPERQSWMEANFHDHAPVVELGGARSYAARLFDYAGAGRDQLSWVIERLRADPQSRSATITTFEPLLDTSYIPCVSMIDFWRPEGTLDVVAYAHSIDFGTKGFANLVQLAELQQAVASALEVPAGSLTFHVKSAHVYERDRAAFDAVLAAAAR
jgi:thymidylate synthase